MSSKEQDGLSQGMTPVGLYLKSDKFQVHLIVCGFGVLCIITGSKLCYSTPFNDGFFTN